VTYIGSDSAINGGTSDDFDIYASAAIRLYTLNTLRATLDASGNLGIGTASPTAKLHLYEPTAAATRIRVLANGGQQAALQLAGNGTTFGTTSFDVFQDGGNDAYVANRANASLQFWTNAIERMRLDASGNLGLGVTPSAWGSGISVFQFGSASSLYNVSGPALAYNTRNDGSNNRYLGADFATIYSQASGQHRWFTAPSGTAGNVISFTQAMTLDASGNLGIGTATFGTSAAGVLALGTGTAPTTGVADTVQFFSVDRSAGNTIPAIRCEGSGVTNAGITNTTVTNKIAVQVNGTIYYLLATTNAT
jgi:hypothetical protein